MYDAKHIDSDGHHTNSMNPHYFSSEAVTCTYISDWVCLVSVSHSDHVPGQNGDTNDLLFLFTDSDLLHTTKYQTKAVR